MSQGHDNEQVVQARITEAPSEGTEKEAGMPWALSQVCPTGPTSVVGGIYYDDGGGPRGQKRQCSPPPGPGAAGTVTIRAASGAIVATVTLAQSQRFDVSVTPGSYTVQGTLAGGPGETHCAGGPITVRAGRITPLPCWEIIV
jgi:hypothetical protein